MLRTTIFYILIAALFVSLRMFSHEENYSVKIITGKEVEELGPFISRLRILEYRNYPYLYEANPEEEKSYIDWLVKLPGTALAVAFFDETPIGFVCGTPFREFAPHYEESLELFEKYGFDPLTYYYVSDDIVLPEHPSPFLKEKLFAAIEQFAKNLGYAALCFVHEHHDQHPLKPTDYVSPDALYSRLGFQETKAAITFAWPTIQKDGSVLKVDHLLPYWIKSIAQSKDEL